MYSISEIARCKLELPEVKPSTKTKEELLQSEDPDDHKKACQVVKQVSRRRLSYITDKNKVISDRVLTLE